MDALYSSQSHSVFRHATVGLAPLKKKVIHSSWFYFPPHPTSSMNIVSIERVRTKELVVSPSNLSCICSVAGEKKFHWLFLKHFKHFFFCWLFKNKLTSYKMSTSLLGCIMLNNVVLRLIGSVHGMMPVGTWENKLPGSPATCSRVICKCSENERWIACLSSDTLWDHPWSGSF